MAHITGGGFDGNLPRALPDGARAVLDRDTWEVPPIFGEIRRLGQVTDREMARVFNLGLGMVMAVGADRVEAVLAALGEGGVDGAAVGRVEAGGRGVELVGTPFWSDGGGETAPAGPT